MWAFNWTSKLFPSTVEMSVNKKNEPSKSEAQSSSGKLDGKMIGRTSQALRELSITSHHGLNPMSMEMQDTRDSSFGIDTSQITDSEGTSTSELSNTPDANRRGDQKKVSWLNNSSISQGSSVTSFNLEGPTVNYPGGAGPSASTPYGPVLLRPKEIFSEQESFETGNVDSSDGIVSTPSHGDLYLSSEPLGLHDEDPSSPENCKRGRKMLDLKKQEEMRVPSAVKAEDETIQKRKCKRLRTRTERNARTGRYFWHGYDSGGSSSDEMGNMGIGSSSCGPIKKFKM